MRNRTEIIVNGAKRQRLEMPYVPVSPVDEKLNELTDLIERLIKTQDRLVDYITNLHDEIRALSFDYDETELSVKELELNLVDRGVIELIHDNIDREELEYRRWLIDEKM